MMPLGIDGCDQDNSKVEELIKLMFRFTGELPGSKESECRETYNWN